MKSDLSRWVGVLGWCIVAGGAVDGAAQTLRLSVTGDAARIQWTAEAGRRYTIEGIDRWGGAWTQLDEVTAADAAAVWIDPMAPSMTTSRFYRVVDRGPASSLSLDQAIYAADLVPSDLVNGYDQSSRDVRDAVVAATLLTQSPSVVTSGTITVSSTSYAPTPTDRLVVVPPSGPTVEFFLYAYTLTQNQNDPIIINHWRQALPDSDLTFTYTPGQEADTATVQGTYQNFAFPGVPFQADLAAIVTGYNRVDLSGSEFLSDATVTGQITAAGFVQTVNTRRRFELVTVSGGNPGSASTNENWLNHSLAYGGDVFVWENVKKQREFRDGSENNWDTYWNAFNRVTRNGGEFAHYRKLLTPVGGSVLDLRFQIVLPGNVIIDVEQWTIQIPDVFL